MMAEDKKEGIATASQKAAPPQISQFAAPQGNHKNAAVGPASGKPLPEWNRVRDYEQFEPTPNK